jgi:hypothetical protein
MSMASISISNSRLITLRRGCQLSRSARSTLAVSQASQPIRQAQRLRGR